MDTLAQYPDIALPGKQVDCRDNELFNPVRAKSYIPWYQRFSKVPINDDISMINAFYNANQASAYAGFKTMPNRHRKLNLLVTNQQIQVIALVRNDLASTIASFVVAMRKQTWRRDGGQQQYRFTFGDSFREQVERHLRYVVSSRWILQSIPGAIHLSYEALCDPDFHHPALDAYFGRRIQLIDPKPPTSARHYVSNWDSFCAFIDDCEGMVQRELRHKMKTSHRAQTGDAGN